MEYVIDCTGWSKEKFADMFSEFSCNTHTKIVLYVENQEKQQENLKQKIVGNYLNKLGIKTHLKGYGYLKYGIVRCLCHPEELESVTKVLYPNIAEKYNTTVGKVEHGIRHAIQKAWENRTVHEWENVFGKTYAGCNSRPTNSQFIATICDFINLNH